MAYRGPKSPQDLHVHAKLKSDMRNDEPLGKTRPCGKASCKTCKMITPTQIVKSASGATIKLRWNTSCKMTNVVYFITCTKYEKQYSMLVKLVIMWTNRWTATRMIGNTSGLRGLLSQNTSVHQNTISWTMHCCLDHNPEWTDRTRKARESYWIQCLNTLPHIVSTRATSRGNLHSLVRACDSLCGMFCSCDFLESQHKLGPFALSLGEKHSVWCISLSV